MIGHNVTEPKQNNTNKQIHERKINDEWQIFCNLIIILLWVVYLYEGNKVKKYIIFLSYSKMSKYKN